MDGQYCSCSGIVARYEEWGYDAGDFQSAAVHVVVPVVLFVDGNAISPSEGIQERSSNSVLNTCFLPNYSSSRLLTIWFTIHDGVNTSAFALVRSVCSSKLFCTRGTMHTVGFRLKSAGQVSALLPWRSVQHPRTHQLRR